MCSSSDAAEQPTSKGSSKLWRIHGKTYDLEAFLELHPGGREVLLTAQGLEDVTPMFESYHALSNIASITQSLARFEYKGAIVDDLQTEEAAMMRGVQKAPVAYTYEDGGFYDVLKGRVKKHFLQRANAAKHAAVAATEDSSASAALRTDASVSVSKLIKVPAVWYLKEVLVLAVYIPLYMTMMGLAIGWGKPSLTARLLCAFAAGGVLQCFSFCTLHDASHYALWNRAPRVQDAISRCCNAWTLWNHSMWVLHHVYGHHRYVRHRRLSLRPTYIIV
jgi:Cytochrome b5-like Heme/Steroid binding domain